MHDFEPPISNSEIRFSKIIPNLVFFCQGGLSTWILLFYWHQIALAQQITSLQGLLVGLENWLAAHDLEPTMIACLTQIASHESARLCWQSTHWFVIIILIIEIPISSKKIESPAYI